MSAGITDGMTSRKEIDGSLKMNCASSTISRRRSRASIRIDTCGEPMGTFPTTTPCLACGHRFDYSSGVDHDNAPQAGDATVCIRCGHLMIFTDDGTLREPTAVERVEMMQDQTVKDVLAAIGKLKS